MGRYVERVWSGNPSGATRAERAPCWFRAYVPDPLVGAEVDEWPARADATRADMAAVVSSAVAAIGGAGASTIEGPHDGDDPPTRWWSRPVQQLLRPPTLPVTSGTPAGLARPHPRVSRAAARRPLRPRAGAHPADTESWTAGPGSLTLIRRRPRVG